MNKLAKIEDDTIIDSLDADQAGEKKKYRVPLVERWVRRGEVEPVLADAATVYGLKYAEVHYGEGYGEDIPMGKRQARMSYDGRIVHSIDAGDELRAIHLTLGAVGADVIESVVGCEMSISDYVRKTIFNGRKMTNDEVKGALKASLYVLVRVFNLR